MPYHGLRLVVLFLAVAAWNAGDVSRADSARFCVRFTDGTTEQGSVLRGFDRDDGTPLLDAKPLLAPERPARWVRDREARGLEPVGPYVEFVGGDRLPGEVVEFRLATRGLVESVPDVFLVRLAWDARPSQSPPCEVVRVARKFVRRIVWQPRTGGESVAPRAVFRDGTSADCLALRPVDDGFRLLLDDGQRHARFSELAEVLLPPVDPWESWLDELATLSPDGAGLVQLLGTTGFLVTTSRSRLVNRPAGQSPVVGRFVIGVQPAWSLDPLWLPSDHVAERRFFDWTELPLTRLAPVLPPRTFAFSRRGPRVDRSAGGDRLQSGGDEFAWGFGVAGESELRFPLSNLVTALHVRYGLDARAGEGGCVKARILAGQPPVVRHETGFVVGSQQPPAAVQLTFDGAAHELVLQVDMAHEGRPAGADPFDIRDAFDWLEPLLLLDGERLKQEVRRRVAEHLPAWADWQPRFDPEGRYRFETQFEESSPQRAAAFRASVRAVDRPLVLSRELSPGSTDRFWLIVAHGGKPPKSDAPATAPQLVARINGVEVAKLSPPSAKPTADPAPLFVSLAPYRGRKVRLELEQVAGESVVPLAWQVLRISDQLPTLRSLFDDEEKFATAPRGEPRAALASTDAHAGAKALRIPAGADARFDVRLPIRPNPQWGEFRFLRFAFRKFGHGRLCLELKHAGSTERPVRYDAGRGPPCEGAAKRVWNLDLPAEWIVMTVDLAAEHGPLDVTGLTLGVPDGEHALFDQVYLARSESDFAAVEARATPEETNRVARTALAKTPLDRGLPRTVALDFGGRWGTGVLLGRDGEVLCAGHSCIAPGREVQVHFADGTHRAGKTLGIDRQLDLALVRVESPPEHEPLEFALTAAMADDELYLGVTHRRGYEPGQRPAAHITQLRATHPDTLITHFELPDHFAGGPLFDREGRLLGIQSRRGKLGGFVYTRVDVIQPALAVLRQPEIAGKWALGSGPMFGVNVTAGPNGCRVLGVIEDSPAAKAQVMAEDVLEKLDDQPIATLEDMQAFVADKDPGHKVKASLRRGQEKRELEFELMPRVP